MNRQDRVDGDGPQIGVIVPAYQARAELPACLRALLELGFAASDMLVVDDGSRDGTGDVARGLGVATLRNETSQRPAKARNRGVGHLDREVILFVDADVTAAPDVRERVAAAFADDPGLTAVFGSYDAAPPAGGLFSRYRNLLHHFTHHRAAGPAGTFWTGLGAVRRDAFLAQGGFDSAWENIEDVEFGMRLAAAGHRIRLDPSIQGTHLKHWTVGSAFRTDLYGRAVPWTRLLAFRGAETGTLNTAKGPKLAATAVALLVASLVVAPLAPGALWLAAAALAGFVVASGPFLRFLWRREGAAFALGAIPCHLSHILAALLGFAKVWLTEALPARLRGAAGG